MEESEDEIMFESERVDSLVNNNDIETKKTKSQKVLSTQNVKKRRLYKRLMLLLTKPSYTLALGSKNARHENRIRLRYLLLKLVRQHNWVEASGVLSVLLKGTYKEPSPVHNRMKYSIAMELLRQMESDAVIYSRKIERLCEETWKRKIVSFKNRPLKDRHVELELILSSLAQNNSDSAKQTVLFLQQQRESVSDPKSNLVIGLTYYEVWYSKIIKQLRDEDLHEECMPKESEAVENYSFGLVEDMTRDDAASIYETCSNLHYQSETSVINNKENDGSSNHCPKGADIAQPVENHQQFRPQGFYMNSFEASSENDGSSQGQFGKVVSHGFNVNRLWSLLPLRLPSLDFLSQYRGLFYGDYKEALKHLQLALHSPPPVSEATLLPLIQLLLLGDEVNEALVVLEKFCNESSSVLAFRLRAFLLECFDANNYDKLSACFEDVLKKDPTCRHSLARLSHFHIKGEYAPERLMEMIALHLEATYADHSTWKEFASCLLKVSHCEEDRTSICVKGEQVENVQNLTNPFRRIPVMFVEGVSGKTWKLRGKWWLSRHYSKDILTSEMAAGDLQLMTYKAACASHLYGNEMEYVVSVHKYVERDGTMLRFLRMHMRNSIGIFSKFVKK